MRLQAAELQLQPPHPINSTMTPPERRITASLDCSSFEEIELRTRMQRTEAVPNAQAGQSIIQQGCWNIGFCDGRELVFRDVNQELHPNICTSMSDAPFLLNSMRTQVPGDGFQRTPLLPANMWMISTANLLRYPLECSNRFCFENAPGTQHHNIIHAVVFCYRTTRLSIGQLSYRKHKLRRVPPVFTMKWVNVIANLVSICF